jgi:large subunit ribosomal protein L7Ae
LVALAAAGSEAKPEVSKPKTVAYGLNTVTSLIERRKVKLVVIPHDVDPLEVGFAVLYSSSFPARLVVAHFV